MKPKLLDLFCSAGGTSMGYYRAGFDVTGVDIDPQPNYPFKFYRGDALKFVAAHGDKYDAIAASPPCQAYSSTRTLHNRKHPELVIPTREALDRTGKPWIMENVPGAPFINPVQLCGSSFGLRVRRHRLFESSFLLQGKECDHAWQDANKCFTGRVSKARGFARPTGTVAVHGQSQMLFNGKTDVRKELELASFAMGINWMTKNELNQAIPPAYTEFIGKQLITQVQ